MIILRKLFSDKDKIVENKKKGVGGAIGIAAGSAGLGAAGGYGFYQHAKSKINEERRFLLNSLKKGRNNIPVIKEELEQAKKRWEGDNKAVETLKKLVSENQNEYDNINKKLESEENSIETHLKSQKERKE